MLQELTLPQGFAPAICLVEASKSYGSRESAASPRNNVVCLEFSLQARTCQDSGPDTTTQTGSSHLVQGCSQNSGLDKAAAGRVGDANQRQPYLSYQGPPLLASKQTKDLLFFGCRGKVLERGQRAGCAGGGIWDNWSGF